LEKGIYIEARKKLAESLANGKLLLISTSSRQKARAWMKHSKLQKKILLKLLDEVPENKMHCATQQIII